MQLTKIIDVEEENHYCVMDVGKYIPTHSVQSEHLTLNTDSN